MIKQSCEICNQDDQLVLIQHHIKSRSKGGTDYPSNITTLCRYCHEYVHNGLIIIEGRFNSSHGNIIVHRKWNEPSITDFKDPEIWLYPNAKVNELKQSMLDYGEYNV